VELKGSDTVEQVILDDGQVITLRDTDNFNTTKDAIVKKVSLFLLLA